MNAPTKCVVGGHGEQSGAAQAVTWCGECDTEMVGPASARLMHLMQMRHNLKGDHERPSGYLPIGWANNEERSMLIVAGTFDVDPELRQEFLRSKEQAMRSSRSEAGCYDYVFSADPLEPGRVLLFERWEDKASLAAHLVRLRSEPAPEVAPVSAIRSELVQYEISTIGPLGS